MCFVTHLYLSSNKIQQNPTHIQYNDKNSTNSFELIRRREKVTHPKTVCEEKKVNLSNYCATLLYLI